MNNNPKNQPQQRLKALDGEGRKVHHIKDEGKQNKKYDEEEEE